MRVNSVRRGVNDRRARNKLYRSGDCITDYLFRGGAGGRGRREGALITISRYLSHLSHMRPLVYAKLSITRILRETSRH